MSNNDLAAQLLDAQVAWAVQRLTGPDLPDLIAQDVDDLLAAGSAIKVADLVAVEDVRTLARFIVENVPPSAVASTLVSVIAGVLHDGPEKRAALSDLLDREHVASLTTEILGMTDVAEEFLDRLTESPMVSMLAARFVGRIFSDVVNANRAMAEKIPGVGSLVSFGAKSAGRVMGAADKQFEQLLGDTAGKGATFAVRRLNAILLDTLRDPSTKAAVLEVYDMYADLPLPPLSEIGRREDIERVAGLIQDIVIGAAPTDAVIGLINAVADGFFDVYGKAPVADLIADVGLSRDDLVSHATMLVPRALAAAQASGELERLIRSRLEPFFSSPEVAAILKG